MFVKSTDTGVMVLTPPSSLRIRGEAGVSPVAGPRVPATPDAAPALGPLPQIHRQAVKSRFHAVGKIVQQRLMADFMGQMREEGPLRPYRSGGRDGFLNVEVGGVRIAPPQCVQHQDPHSPQGVQRAGREALAVGDIAEVPDPETEDGVRPVRDREREEGAAQDLHRLKGTETGEAELWDRAAWWSLDRFVEDIREAAEKLPVRAFRAEHGHVLLGSESKDAEVVRPVDVVCMEVGKPHRFDEPYPLPHQLEP